MSLIFPVFDAIGLHILYLKRDITQFPRNAFANQIEVYCSKFFYGPLVVVFCDTKPPYKLHDFPPQYLIDEIEPLNELEQKCYPLPFGKLIDIDREEGWAGQGRAYFILTD